MVAHFIVEPSLKMDRSILKVVEYWFGHRVLQELCGQMWGVAW
jgi:hypothetical protein